MNLVKKFNFDVLSVICSYLTPKDAEILQQTDKATFEFVYSKQAGFIPRMSLGKVVWKEILIHTWLTDYYRYERVNEFAYWVFFNPRLFKAYKEYSKYVPVRIANYVLHHYYDTLTCNQVEFIFKHTRPSLRLESTLESRGHLEHEKYPEIARALYKQKKFLWFHTIFFNPSLIVFLLTMDECFTIGDCVADLTYHGIDRNRVYDVYGMLNHPRLFDLITTKHFYEQNIVLYLNKPSPCCPILPIQEWFYLEAWSSLQDARAKVKWNTDTPANKFKLLPKSSRMDDTLNAFPDDFFATMMTIVDSNEVHLA